MEMFLHELKQKPTLPQSINQSINQSNDRSLRKMETHLTQTQTGFTKGVGHGKLMSKYKTTERLTIKFSC